ncbi:MAG: YdeI/OmpD-associated family protein [Bacteroidota bacterium]|nr:YdeI/OmpD-associated family protein [Bacteroidota bacterium]
MNHKIDFFFEKESKWQKEYKQLREIVLDCGLNEELKWGQPCYSLNGKNILLIHGFKDYCAYLFFKGTLLKDDKHILIQQTEHVQSPRQARFTSVKEIIKLEKTLKAYIYEAIEVEKAGLKVKQKKTSDYEVAAEFQKKLNEDKTLKAAFKALTPGRQRSYLFYFSQAKQSKTREARIEKCIPDILKGKGLND